MNDWRSRYIQPGANGNDTGCWILPDDENLLNDFRSFGGCITTFTYSLTEHAGWQKLFLTQLFEKLFDTEFKASFKRIFDAGSFADLIMPALNARNELPTGNDILFAIPSNQPSGYELGSLE